MNSLASSRPSRINTPPAPSSPTLRRGLVLPLVAGFCWAFIVAITPGCDGGPGSSLSGESSENLVQLLIGADLAGQPDMARAFAVELLRRGSTAMTAIDAGIETMEREARMAASAANDQAALTGEADPQVVEIELKYRVAAAHLRAVRAGAGDSSFTRPR